MCGREIALDGSGKGRVGGSGDGAAAGDGGCKQLGLGSVASGGGSGDEGGMKIML